MEMPNVMGSKIIPQQYCLLVTMVSVAWQDHNTFLTFQPNAITASSGQHLTPAFHFG